MTMLDQKDYKRQKADGPRGNGYLRSLTCQIVSRHAAPGVPGLTTGVNYYLFDNSADAICFSAELPADYDNSATYSANDTLPSDQLFFEVTCAVTVTGGVGDSSLEIDTFRYVRVGNAIGGTNDAVATTVSLTTAQTGLTLIGNTVAVRVRWDLSGLGLRPRDAVNLTLGCTKGTDDIAVYGAQFLYRTNEVPTNGLTDSTLY